MRQAGATLCCNTQASHCTGSSCYRAQALGSNNYFLFFYQFIYFNWRLITLQYCGDFCDTFARISHRHTCVLHPEPRSDLPPHRIPLGCPNTPAISVLLHALNLDRSSTSHVVIYMFQCCSLKSSHPRLLPQSPKVCSLYLCLFCCLAYRVTYHLSKFHIYVLIYYIGVFLSDLLHSV